MVGNAFDNACFLVAWALLLAVQSICWHEAQAREVFTTKLEETGIFVRGFSDLWQPGLLKLRPHRARLPKGSSLRWVLDLGMVATAEEDVEQHGAGYFQ